MTTNWSEVCSRCGTTKGQHAEVVGTGFICPMSYSTFAGPPPCPSCASLREAIRLRDENDKGLFMEGWKHKMRADAAEAALAQARGDARDAWLKLAQLHTAAKQADTLAARLRELGDLDMVNAALARLSEEQAPPEGSSDKPEGTK